MFLASDGFSRWVCTDAPPVIGSHAGYVPTPLLRLVLTLGIYCLSSCDAFSRWVYNASPPAVGSQMWKRTTRMIISTGLLADGGGGMNVADAAIAAGRIMDEINELAVWANTSPITGIY
eukprot:847217-Prorocentrum_minimum.AAC.2